MQPQFQENAQVRIVSDKGRDYGHMLGREGTIKMQCMRRYGLEYYLVRIKRDHVVDEIKVAAIDLELVAQ